MLFGSLWFKNCEALVAISICDHSPRSRQGVNRIKNIEYIYKFRVEQKPFEVLKNVTGIEVIWTRWTVFRVSTKKLILMIYFSMHCRLNQSLQFFAFFLFYLPGDWRFHLPSYVETNQHILKFCLFSAINFFLLCIILKKYRSSCDIF